MDARGGGPPLTAASAPDDETLCTVHPLVIPLCCEPPSRATEQEVRKPPGHLQTVSSQLKNHLHCPLACCRFLTRIQVLAPKASHPEEVDVLGCGASQEPLYDVLGSMDSLGAELFQRAISRCVWECYDVVLWHVVKERACHRRAKTRWSGFDDVPLDLKSFPTTEEGFEIWLAAQNLNPLFATSTRFRNGTIEISDYGESKHPPSSPIHSSTCVSPSPFRIPPCAS